MRAWRRTGKRDRGGAGFGAGFFVGTGSREAGDFFPGRDVDRLCGAVLRRAGTFGFGQTHLPVLSYTPVMFDLLRFPDGARDFDRFPVPEALRFPDFPRVRARRVVLFSVISPIPKQFGSVNEKSICCWFPFPTHKLSSLTSSQSMLESLQHHRDTFQNLTNADTFLQVGISWVRILCWCHGSHLELAGNFHEKNSN